MISLDNVLRSLFEGNEVEGSYNYYDSCDILKAMILHYFDKKVPILSPLRKRGETKVFKGGIFKP